ncbi:MAG TPA: DUF4402 domain-containing protein [Croceibacterium sp.]
MAALAAASAPALGPVRSDAPSTQAKAAAKAPAAPTASAPTLQPRTIADPFATVGPNGERALSITVDSGISVGRLGLQGRKDGDAAIDPQTGAKRIGANMVDLGGLTYQGKATITGQPLKPVRIELPQTVTLFSPTGAEAELRDFRTDLPGVAMLDASGQLQFNFGATITSKGGQGGNFRGRIPIRVEYY